MPSLPNVTAVNALGDYHIAADRLAFIDGEGMFGPSAFSPCSSGNADYAWPAVDPWRPYTPHSNYGGAVERDDTLLRPFKIIPGAF